LPAATTKTRDRPQTIEDLYGGGDNGNFLNPRYAENPKAIAWFQRRHSRGALLIDADGVYRTRDGEHEWKVPYGVRVSMGHPLSFNQVIVKYPFYVIWRQNGKRCKKYVSTMIGGIHLIATRLQYVDPQAALVSRSQPYHVPPKLRGKFPLARNGKTYYWCPCCMTARRFFRTGQEFFGNKKFWSDEKGAYEWKEVKLALTQCPYCGITNREPRFRQSNQPYEVRKIKRGVRRVKRRKRVKTRSRR
jgi:hypothetical protein